MPGLRWLDVAKMPGLRRLDSITMPGLQLDVAMMPGQRQLYITTMLALRRLDVVTMTGLWRPNFATMQSLQRLDVVTMLGMQRLDVATMLCLRWLGVVTMPSLHGLNVVTIPGLQQHDAHRCTSYIILLPANLTHNLHEEKAQMLLALTSQLAGKCQKLTYLEVSIGGDQGHRRRILGDSLSLSATRPLIHRALPELARYPEKATCKNKCLEKFDDVDKAVIHDSLYGELHSKDEPDIHLQWMIEVRNVAKHRPRKDDAALRVKLFKYHVLLRETKVEVCRQAFFRLSALSDKRIKRVRELLLEVKSPHGYRQKYAARHLSAIQPSQTQCLTAIQPPQAQHLAAIQSPEAQHLATIHRAACGIRQRAGIVWPEFVGYHLPDRFQPDSETTPAEHLSSLQDGETTTTEILPSQQTQRPRKGRKRRYPEQNVQIRGKETGTKITLVLIVLIRFLTNEAVKVVIIILMASRLRRNVKNKEFFESDIILGVMYENYKLEVNKPVSMSKYKAIFYMYFNIKRKALKKDTCSRCDSLHEKMQSEEDHTQKEALHSKHENH
ncbi:hypothetical protein PR048_018155 [Dryococelus australis]|uniref:Uncharacterized protein n=1 Tax=Dryococelus australis TaxID=614101 RepID=A0ABQ9HBL9_9NEOP|nr:hypothetical protein PR048_018155 [Dryococelus australis]